jgi:uncharacterized protein YdaU (DUF1376 family)
MIVVRLHRQIFRHIAQKCSAIQKVLPAFFRQSDGKDASKRATKASAAHCAVLAYIKAGCDLAHLDRPREGGAPPSAQQLK